MKRAAIALAVVVAMIGTAAASDSGCWAKSGYWTVILARGNTTGNYYVVDSFDIQCWATPNPHYAICYWDHIYSVTYQYKPGSNIWIPLDSSKADHSHSLRCGDTKTVSLERSRLGNICGPRPGVAVEVTDYLWTGPAPQVQGAGVIPTNVKIERRRFKCPPLVSEPPDDGGGLTP